MTTRVARYRYDAMGNRIAKTVGRRTTYFLYDTAHQLVAEADEDGHLTSQYLYADQRPVAVLRAPHAQDGGQTRELFAIHADHRGLPLAVTDDKGSVVWKGDFDPFGKTRPVARPTAAANDRRISLTGAADVAATGSFAMNLRMAGQYEDVETGLYYNMHRYYDPLTGSYITPDPIGLAGGSDAYAYVEANPLGRVDPLGLFPVPAGAFLGNDSIFVTRKLPFSDGGHGDIVRIAFAQLAMEAGGPRFSQTIIDQIVLNNYHTDANGTGCITYIPNGSISGGGQCNANNHFDNPNMGPLYSTMPDPTNPAKVMTKLAAYTDRADDNWITDALDQVNANRSNYGRVVNAGGVWGNSSISGLLNAFGQNSHALADFYTHTNWTDSSAFTTSVVNGKTVYKYARGGEVNNYSYTDPATGKTAKICGWVPTGLNMSTIWDESTGLDRIFSGSAHGIGETKTSNAAYTHSYWNKDSKDETGGKQLYLDKNGNVDTALLNSFDKNNISYWSIETFIAKKTPTDRDPSLSFGVDWYGDNGKPQKDLRADDRIYVRKFITNRHEMAFYLAIEHTKKEIMKLYDTAVNQTVKKGGSVVETFTLREVFTMNAEQLRHNRIFYDNLYQKDNGQVTFP